MSSFFDCNIDPGVVVRAQQGDRQAHELLFRTYSAPVHTLARRLIPVPAVAEEVLQETFLEVIRRVETFRAEAPFGAWIRKITVNKCLMHLRSAWHRNSETLAEGVGHLPDRAPDAPPERYGYGSGVQARLDLEDALEQLPAVTRTVVWLHDVEGYTHREISELMGKSPSFSKSQLARAHRRLKRLLAGPEEAGSCSEARPCMQVSNS